MTQRKSSDARDPRVPIDLTRTDTSALPLPEARLTSDEPIEVSVPAAGGVSHEELLERFTQLAREHAEVREREVGEAVGMGDDVQVDIIGYAHERLLPFSLRSRWWMEMKPQPAMPGFTETLAGSAVGDSVGLQLVLPADYPIEALRSTPARFMIDLLAARELRLHEPTSPELFYKLGRGGTLDEVMASLAQELLEEKARQRRQQAQQQVLDVLASRLEVELPDSLIDEEIRRRWVKTEGPLAQDKNFTAEETAEAFEVWRTDAATRTEAERRLRIALALKAVIERDRLKLDPNEVFEILDRNMAAYGLTEAEVSEGLASPETYLPMLNLAWHLRAVEHVMAQARVHIGDEAA